MLEDALGDVSRRLVGIRVSELDANHQTQATHVAHHGIACLNFVQAIH